MADDSVIVKFGGSIDALAEAVAGARGLIVGFGKRFAELNGTATAGEFDEAFAAAFAVEKLHTFAEPMAELGAQTSRASQILGVSTEEIGVCGIRRWRAPSGGDGCRCNRLAGG